MQEFWVSICNLSPPDGLAPDFEWGFKTGFALNPICILIFAAMQRLLQIGKNLFSNFYLGTSFLFLVWVTFFDGNDLISLVGNQMKLMETESEIQFYQEKVNEVMVEHSKLAGSTEAMEQFAREKFLMKRDNEDVFLIKETTNKSILERLTGE